MRRASAHTDRNTAAYVDDAPYLHAGRDQHAARDQPLACNQYLYFYSIRAGDEHVEPNQYSGTNVHAESNE